MSKSVAIVGYGVVGTAYHKMFPDAVIYDEPKNLCFTSGTFPSGVASKHINVDGDNYDLELSANTKEQWVQDARIAVNECDVAIVAVWTGLLDNGKLDVSVVEEVVDWIECPLIIIKSALYPGTVDKLVNKTGKRIAVSVEYIGEGDYPVQFWKFPHQSDPRLHQMLVVGGEEDTAEEASQILWRKLSPDVKVHKVTALEAEQVKLIENAYGALKVTFANTFLSLAIASDSSYIRMHQAWNSDPRTDSMHLRAVEHERGWRSRCWDKDVIALITWAREIGAEDMANLFETVVMLNQRHLELNER